MITRMIHAVLWLALGGLLIWQAAMEPRGTFPLVVACIGMVAVLNGVAALRRWRLWKITGRVLGVIMIFYSLVALVGHPDDVGGPWMWLMLIAASCAFGVWSIVCPRTGARNASEGPPPPSTPPSRDGHEGPD